MEVEGLLVHLKLALEEEAVVVGELIPLGMMAPEGEEVLVMMELIAHLTILMVSSMSVKAVASSLSVEEVSCRVTLVRWERLMLVVRE